MSESPKMGLFGSKDETKETKKEIKDNSPDRYAPYCIDSDSETYDTEALSIMDINDIIGVQSEPVSDSTLESEIAALSQMITESKTDASQNTTEKKLEMQEKNVTKDEEAPIIEKNDTIRIFDTNEHVKSTLKDLENVCCVKGISDNMEQSSKDNFQFSSENSLQENVQLCEQEKDNDSKDTYQSNVLTDSVDIVSTKDIKHSNTMNEVTVELIHSTSGSISVTSEIMKSEENVNKSNISEQQSSHNEVSAVNSKVTIIENENSIRGSLQLIGEAYSSEDSQDGITNDEEPSGTNLSTSSNEKCLIPHEEKNNINEVCEVQKDVNNISEEIDNIHLDKACTNENISAETIENEKLCSSEIELSNCPTKPTYAGELPTISEDTKDIVPNEYKIDNLSNIDLQCEKENINTTTTDTNNIKEEILEEEKIDIQVVKETIMMEHSEIEVEKENIESIADVYVTEEEPSETKVKDENAVIESDQETTEDIGMEKEKHDKITECTDEEKERNQENVEHVNNSNIENNFINRDQLSNVESNDEVSFDNDTEIIEEEIELNVKPVQSEVESEDINNSTTTVKLKEFDSPYDTNNLELPKSKVDKVELSELKDMEIEKLEVVETELQDSLELLTNQLSPKTTNQTHAILNESSMLSEQSSSELPLNSDDVIDNIDVSTETNIEAENEENKEIKIKNNLKSVSFEVINIELKEDIVESVDETELKEDIVESIDETELKEDIVESIDETELKEDIVESVDETELKEDIVESVDETELKEDIVESVDETELKEDIVESVDETELPSIQEKTENELETSIPETCDTVDKYEVSMEVDLNVDSGTSILETTVNEIENNSNERINQLLIEDTDKITQEMEVNLEIIKIEDHITKEQDQESNKVDHTLTEEGESERMLDIVHDFYEVTESKSIQSIELHDNIDVEKQTEVDKQVEEHDTVEKEIEEEHITKEQIEEENTAGRQIEEEDVSEKQIKEGKKEDFAPKIVVEGEQSIEMKIETNELQNFGNMCNVIEKNHSGESKGNVIQKEVNVKAEETNDYANEEESASDLKFINKDMFPAVDHIEIIVPEEDVKEEHMEEEMNLALESEETESQSEMVKNDIEEKSEIEKGVELPEEIMAECQENVIIKVNDNIADSINLERSSGNDLNIEGDVESNDAQHLELNKDEELSDKQQLEDDSKSDTNKDNLKDILETANNVEEMFSGEQCQNTEDIVTSILDDVRTATDFKNILSPEAVVANEIADVLQQTGDLPLVESEIEELTEKLPQDSEDILNKDMEDSISTQNIDTLEGLLGLDLIPEGEDSTLKMTKTEEERHKPEQLSKVVDMRLLLEQSNHTSDIAQASDYITHVISSCLTDRDSVSLEDTTEKSNIIEGDNDKGKESEADDILKIDESLISESMDKDDNVEDLQKDLGEGTDIPDTELDMDFEEAPLESVGDLEETESKLELTSDILLHNVDQGENLNDAPSVVETSQPSSEISELESAVKFLQESEEQAMDSPLVLSPKMVESVVDDISKQADAASLFVPDEDMCENTVELEAELQNIATDSISISEAEIISEAAKLESERKLAEQIKIDALQDAFGIDDKEMINQDMIEHKIAIPTCSSSQTKFDVTTLKNIEVQQAPNLENKKIAETLVALPQNILKTSESIPKVSILEERLKEPPKIEIPATDVTKVSMSPTTSKDSLLIQKDAKLIAYQKMLESPKLFDKSESKFVETPRKDSEKHDFENVGSPRIILKIAKSAITDCGEPRSPKSPKIRSATNSPNPEDSPGQKLGKIKLKLSKGGHPSIISNENVEELGQWYSEGSSSLSPIGMKIKLSKSGDASIVTTEKHELTDDSKEGKHKFEETKRTESPIGMKIKLSKSGDASIVQQDAKEIQMKHKDKLDMVQGSPKRTESPIGMKIKLSKTGDASIIQPERQELSEEYKDNIQVKPKEKHESCYDSPKRTDSPIGMKIKLSKSGDASIVSPDLVDENKEMVKTRDKLESPPEIPKRTESPIGMKIKLAKTKGGGASIISVENSEESKDKLEIPDIPKRTESPLGMKIKLSKSGDASIVHSEVLDEIKDNVDITQDATKSLEVSHSNIEQETVEPSIEVIHEALPKVESPIGMKIKLSKSGDASIVPSEKQEQLEESKLHQEIPKRTESPLGMKIKLSKTGDASIIQPDISEDTNKIIRTTEAEHSKITDASLGMKIKLLKTGDASIVDSEKKDRQQRRRDTESSLEMKIKLSKTGHPTIVACDNQAEVVYKSKESTDSSQNFVQRYKETGQAGHKEPALKILKTGHSTILQSNRSELTIEPVQIQGKKLDNVVEMSPKRKDITIAPIESKKSKLETQLTQILPEVTIQPVTSREQKQFLFDPKNSAISLQQMNVINQEISITQVRPQKSTDVSMNEKLKDILSKNVAGSPMNSDCEIIEHRPELIIVNENSNSSQDVVIIEEVSPNRMPEVKVPKKRGRPRRNPLPQGITHPPPHLLIPRDPLSLDDAQQMQQPQIPHFPESRENERPKRTCRSQKSYAPPKRGRGRGRGKRKLDNVDPQIMKKPRIDQDLNAIEASTTAVITIDDSGVQQESFGKSPELYKALKQPAMDSKMANSSGKVNKKIMRQKNSGIRSANVVNNTLPDTIGIQPNMNKGPEIRLPKPVSNDVKDSIRDKKLVEIIPERMQKATAKIDSDNRSDKSMENVKSENKDMLIPPGHPNWLTPASKRADNATKHENMSTVQVIDEETRMSAESGSRSQTPARNISAPASETIVNEESQGSVLSTATTESEKVKVKNRRMEINFDPDEGPFTVDKIAEYEWPLDRKGETFMIQEQISQYLGVKSFKRKYPDLKRRVVDMEERNYLRENGLVSEAMCDMGLTAVCSSEVLDVMCSDFPDQYEEYRKHMREKQVKEHSKKQKELTAAANAEKNRIDLAEMAVQSALSWNISLNKARRENRKCSLDLQTFTIHVPKKQQKVESERRIGHYPVALIPGQYTDYYREYTPAELRYYPLNTVLYGPMRPNERKFDSQSEGSQSDSDSDSSSDDSSSSSSEGTQDTEGSQSTMDEVDMEIANQKDEIKLKCKMCLKTLNKHSKNEVLIQCGTCNGHVHPSCIDLTLDMVPHIQSYAWQCTDCKTCAQCHDPADEDKMLFCDMCDRGYHIYCVGLRRVPQGRWHCQECAVCANCGSREPGGINSDRNSVAQWQHEYKKGDKNTRVYVSTLCVPCSKLWRKGRYCPHCSRCHTAPRLDLEVNLVHCSACDKYLHLGCVETKGMPLDRKNYLCDFCAPNRQQMMKPLVSKTLKT